MTRSTRTVRPSQCQCCSHPDRARIELLRAGGASLRTLAEKFSISKDSIHRHFAHHVTDARRAELLAGPAKVEELANKAAEESKSLIDYLSIARSVLFNQFLNAAEMQDRAGVANVGARLIEVLREVGRVTGELRTLSGITINNNTLNLVTSPAFLQLQDGLLHICRSHPTVRDDIVGLLRTLDAPGLPLAPTPKPNGMHRTIEGEAIHVVA